MVINNLENDNRKVVAQLGSFAVLEYEKDMSVAPWSAEAEYFMSKMNVRRRQVICNLNGSAVRIQAGAMQWTAGNIQATSGIKGGVGGFLGSVVKSAVTNESVAKPEYQGTGTLMLEPTYKYVVLQNLANWGGSMTVEDGMFLACDATVQEHVVARSNLSSAVLGGEGLFNLSLQGQGVVALESSVPYSELIEFELQGNDELKIDGNLAVAWSSSLQFTVEKSAKSLIGSAVSGEGLVNVYRGQGKVLMAPVASTSGWSAPVTTTSTTSD